MAGGLGGRDYGGNMVLIFEKDGILLKTFTLAMTNFCPLKTRPSLHCATCATNEK